MKVELLTNLMRDITRDIMNIRINRLLDSYKAEMADSLSKLIQIKSVAAESRPGAPFGEGIRESLEFVMNLGKNKGFECINFDNYACELNIISSAETTDSVGVISHLDVVPEGSGWTHDPYGGEIEDGKIYGRGAVDDKGALIAAFYACCAIKDSGLKLSKNIKHIIGTNEEGGEFPCIKYYKEHGKVPGCGIVPDSWFPVAFAEKGFYNYKFYRKFGNTDNNGKADIQIVNIKGGEALNIVASDASAELIVSDRGKETVVNALDSFLADDKILMEENDNKLIIKAAGKAAHASTPETGINAISNLLLILKRFGFSPSDLCETLHGLAAEVAKDTDGTGLGVNCKDDTGELTNNIGMISYDGDLLTLKMNLRCPVSATREVLESKLKKAAKAVGTEYELINYNPHYYMPVEDPLNQLLIGVYQEMTGDTKSKPKAHGGGSYARALKNFVPFGPWIQGEEPCFHKPDEFITCDRLLLLSKIYAEALYRLAK